MKAKLIIDMPERCGECSTFNHYVSLYDKSFCFALMPREEIIDDTVRPEWCPLIPIESDSDDPCERCKHYPYTREGRARCEVKLDYCNNCKYNYESIMFEPIESEII